MLKKERHQSQSGKLQVIIQLTLSLRPEYKPKGVVSRDVVSEPSEERELRPALRLMVPQDKNCLFGGKKR